MRSYKDFNIRWLVQILLSHYYMLLHLFLSGHCMVMKNCVNHAGMPWGAFLAEAEHRSHLPCFLSWRETTRQDNQRGCVRRLDGAAQRASCDAPATDTTAEVPWHCPPLHVQRVTV